MKTILVLLFLSTSLMAKTITMTDWTDFKKYKTVHNLNKIQHQVSGKSVELRFSGQVKNTNVERLEWGDKIAVLLPLIKTNKYLIDESLLPKDIKSNDIIVGYLKTESSEESQFIIYNKKTKNFGLFLGVIAKTNKEELNQKEIREMQSKMDKKVFWASIRYLYK